MPSQCAAACRLSRQMDSPRRPTEQKIQMKEYSSVSFRLRTRSSTTSRKVALTRIETIWTVLVMRGHVDDRAQRHHDHGQHHACGREPGAWPRERAAARKTFSHLYRRLRDRHVIPSEEE